MTSMGGLGDSQVNIQSAVSIGGAAGMTTFGDEDANKKVPDDLRKTYLKKFGVEMNLPAYYIKSALFVPHVKDHIIVTVNHILPKSFECTVQTTWMDGNFDDEQDYNELGYLNGKDLIFKLQKVDGRKGF